MRVALVTYALQIGGVETFLRLLADFFIAAGHEVSFAETQRIGRWCPCFKSEGYKVIEVLPKPLFSRYHHARRIAKILRDFDLIILNDAPYAQSALGLLTEKTITIPVLHLSLSSMVHNATANSNNWDVLSAVSPAVRQCVLHSGIDAARVACIPNGIKVSEKWPKKDYDFKQTKPLLVTYLGGINHNQKGVLHLPRILRQVLEEGVNCHLEIVGDGPDIGRLRDELKHECSGADIVLRGALPNQKAMEVLSRSDILIMPSHFEGLPLVLLEAMALGVVPVVSSLPGCTDFVVENGVNGLLVEAGSEIGFAKALNHLGRDRDLLKSMSLSAWRTVRNRFSYIHMGEAYLELFQKCKRRWQRGERPPRTQTIDFSLLGDLPFLPILLVRPVRKILRALGLFAKPIEGTLPYTPEKID
jgi:glycosyltransferase involved in cell wall biosynthesis